jgi:tRNA A-37 threonylcarbamoyl transferase component Bud32
MDEEPRTQSWAPGRHTPPGPRLRPVPLPEPGTVLAERFVIEAVLGKGGSGVVYVARDRRLGQRVAIKLLHPDLVNDSSRERLRREVQAARHGHANVVTVYDLHDDGGPMPFVSMELVDGQSLAHVLAHERHRLAIEETISIGRQIAAALDHVHGHGLVHRDLKPSNILLTPAGSAKLCDLGLVRQLEHGMTMTASAVTVGTPAYMAPEQGTNREVTAKADVYALGLTLYECLTGKVPFVGDTAVDTLVRRQKARPPALRRDDPSCPRWLERLLARMLEPRPADRPSAIAVARALETRRVRRRISRRLALLTAATVALCAAGIVGWRALTARETVRIEVAGAEVRGVGAGGQPTWRVALQGPAEELIRVDLDGDGTPEAVVTTSPGPAVGSSQPAAGVPRPAEVVAVSTRGRMITRLVPADAVVARWSHPYAPTFALKANAIDLDGDGAAEILLNAMHETYYPNALFVYWPRWDTWDWLLDHTGRLSAFGVVADSSRPRLQVAGVNNRLGMLPIYGEVDIVPPPQRTVSSLEPPGALQSPQDGFLSGTAAMWRDYVLLPEATRSPSYIERRGESVVLVTSAGDETVLDGNGNLVGGPNAGTALREVRLALLAGVASLRNPASPMGAAEVSAAAASLRERVAPLLAEAPYRAVLDLAEARALARAGDPAAARDVLRGTWAFVRHEEVGYRLAHFEAVTGRLADAIATLRGIIASAHNFRGFFDARHLLVRVAVEASDRPKLEEALDLVGRSDSPTSRNADVAAVVQARARLWWNEPSSVDERVRSNVYTPEGDAIASLARWRLGHPRPDEIDAMRALIKAAPDAAAETTIALGAAQLASGAPIDAIATLDRLMFTIAIDAREDFAVRQMLDLAQALRARALVAAGRPADARAAASELLSRLTPGLLPAILCHEVLGRRVGTHAAS